MSALKKLAGQTGIYGISSIVGRFLNYLLVPLYTTKFLAAEYGVVTEFYAYVAVLQVLLTYGMETGYFRFSEKLSDRNRVFSTVLTSLLSTSSLFLLLVIIFSGSISSFLGYENSTDYVIIFAIILSVDAVSAIFFARLRSLNKAKKFMFLKLGNISINILLNLFFILLCPYLEKKGINIFSFIYNPDYGVGYIFISNLVASIFVLLLFIPDFFSIKFVFDRKVYKQIILYSLPLLITGLTGVFNDMADRILIKYWTVVPDYVDNPNQYVMYQLGIYGANAKLAVIMLMFVQAFRYAAEPFFFKYQKQNDSLKVFADVMKYYIIFAFFIFLAIILNLDIVKYFIHKSYFEGLNVVFPLFLGRILVGVFFILSFWYKLNDLTKYGVVIFASGTVFTLIVDYFFIPKYGYIAAAWTNFCTYLVMVIISFVWSRKYMKTEYQYFRIFIYVFFALTLYFISVYLITVNNVFLKLILSNMLLILYVIVVFRIEKFKLSQILNVIKKRIK